MNAPKNIKLIECPRDAMQGWSKPISTEMKVAYINALLPIGFDTIDFGSFVSPKAIPQMADTKAVLSQLDLSKTKSKLLAIVANLRGAEEAATFESIHYLGYPFSISETFQQRNTNASIDKSFEQLTDMVALCAKHNKSLVVYISMGFGNPYGDEYNEDIVFHWANKIANLGVNIISLADTVGLASPAQIKSITGNLIQSLPDTEIGVHLHSAPNNWKLKLEAAIEAGCVRFDGALKGFGGCPMAGDDLVGNMDTERLIRYFEATTALKNINEEALTNALAMASTIFSY